MESEIRDAGARLVAISPQIHEHSAKMVAQRKYHFPMLRDEGNTIAAEYGLRFRLPDDLEAIYRGFGLDLPESNGEDSWTLPMPARYVVDQGGTVRWAAVHADYTRRPEPAETLGALSRLA